MRRFLTFLLVSAATAAGTLWWLHDGDLRAVIQPTRVERGAPPGDGLSEVP